MTEINHKQAFCSLPSCTRCSAAANDLAKMHKTLATLARTILTRPASALLGNVAAVSVPRLLRRLFAHIHVADFGTVVAAGLGVFSHETPQGLERLRPLHLCMQGPKASKILRNEFSSSCESVDGRTSPEPQRHLAWRIVEGRGGRRLFES